MFSKLEKFCIYINQNAYFYLKPFILNLHIDSKTDSIFLRYSVKPSHSNWYLFWTVIYTIQIILALYVIIIQGLYNGFFFLHFKYGRYVTVIIFMWGSSNCLVWGYVLLFHKEFVTGLNQLVYLRLKVYKGE